MKTMTLEEFEDRKKLLTEYRLLFLVTTNTDFRNSTRMEMLSLANGVQVKFLVMDSMVHEMDINFGDGK